MGEIVVSITSVNTLKSAVAVAERKVQQDQARVEQDEDRLDDSRNLLSRDRETLSRTQTESLQAQAAAAPTLSAPRLDRAIEKPIPANLLPQPAQLNAQGQTIGRLINIIA